MFIRVNKVQYKINEDRNIVPSSYGIPIAINVDKINTISDKYKYKNEYFFLQILTTTGEEIKCTDLFDDIDKQLNYKFVKFKVWSTVTEDDFIYVLINKDNVVSVQNDSFGTEIRFQDPLGRCVYVNESVDEVIRRLTNGTNRFGRRNG